MVPTNFCFKSYIIRNEKEHRLKQYAEMEKKQKTFVLYYFTIFLCQKRKISKTTPHNDRISFCLNAPYYITICIYFYFPQKQRNKKRQSM